MLELQPSCALEVQKIRRKSKVVQILLVDVSTNKDMLDMVVCLLVDTWFILSNC